MPAPALDALTLEILTEFKPLLIGDGRASAPRLARSRRRSRVAMRGSYIGLGEGDPHTTGNGLGDGWLRESMLEMSEGDSERFGGGVRAYLSHSFDSKSPIFPQAQEICRSLSEGAGN